MEKLLNEIREKTATDNIIEVELLHSMHQHKVVLFKLPSRYNDFTVLDIRLLRYVHYISSRCPGYYWTEHDRFLEKTYNEDVEHAMERLAEIINRRTELNFGISVDKGGPIQYWVPAVEIRETVPSRDDPDVDDNEDMYREDVRAKLENSNFKVIDIKHNSSLHNEIRYWTG